MAYFKARIKPMSTNITNPSYQYGHRWQRERKFTSKRGYRVISSPYLPPSGGVWIYLFPQQQLFKLSLGKFLLRNEFLTRPFYVIWKSKWAKCTSLSRITPDRRLSIFTLWRHASSNNGCHSITWHFALNKHGGLVVVKAASRLAIFLQVF